MILFEHRRGALPLRLYSWINTGPKLWTRVVHGLPVSHLLTHLFKSAVRFPPEFLKVRHRRVHLILHSLKNLQCGSSLFLRGPD